MKTKVTAYGRRGSFSLADRSFYATRSVFTIEPWSGLYYVFHGACLPLILERVVGQYRDHRVRANFWNRQEALSQWQEMQSLWIPVIDFVTDLDFHHYIGFSFHPYRIEWFWNQQYGDSEELTQRRIQGLTELFDELGSSIRRNQIQQNTSWVATGDNVSS